MSSVNITALNLMLLTQLTKSSTSSGFGAFIQTCYNGPAIIPTEYDIDRSEVEIPEYKPRIRAHPRAT